MSSLVRAGSWRLVLLVLLAGAAFAVEESVTASAQAHAIMQVTIFLITIGLMALCVRSDERAATRQAISRLIVLDMLDVDPPAAAPSPQRVGEVRHIKVPTSNH